MEKIQIKDCGECNYCKRKCSCPACNGYSSWGGCDGCRNPVQQSKPALEDKKENTQPIKVNGNDEDKK